jgi:2-deoxy-D-gluconate 3-dehydrogenase
LNPPPSRFDVSRKSAFVTGGVQGLGRIIAHGLSAAGARVAITSRDPERANTAAEEIQRETGKRVSAYACDLTSWPQIDGLVEQVYRDFQTIDILVNNAAVYPGRSPVAELDEDTWDEVLRVNLLAPARLSARVASRMATQGGGSIINVASAAAYLASPNIAAYVASKAALIALTRVLAAEWGMHRVRVNSISPGPFLTEMLQEVEVIEPGYQARFADRLPLKRLGDPQEIVGAVIYLGSDASSFVTAEDHLVAAGMLR